MLLFLHVLAYLLAGCSRSAMPASSATDLPIPAMSDWTDYGPIFDSGSLGEWDYLLWGGFTGTVVKKNGVFYLYYQGASGYRSSFDETVTGRAIGVATSPDGINFTKYRHNPVITWSPNDNGEEGAFSAGATLDDNGEIVLYYGANTEQTRTLINADARLAVSTDGFNFTDMGVVLDHSNGSIWGSRDELFPIIALRDAGQWFVYYIPNGSLQSRKLGVAWGDVRDNLTISSGALSGISTIQVWGMGGIARIGPNTFALFLNDVTESKVEVRTVSSKAPNQLSAPVMTYQFEGVRQATVFLDEGRSTWFMYYRDADSNKYGIKLAPAGAPDTSPPTAPGYVTAEPVSDQQIDLSWEPATDGETGIVQYKVFRNGEHIATVKGWTFSDTGLDELTEYSYEVFAINYHGVEGRHSAPVSATTPADVNPPTIKSVSTSGSANQITLVFDEPVEQVSAEGAGNYSVNKCVAVKSASLDLNLDTVTLTTSGHSYGTYRITVKNIRDRAATPNSIAYGTETHYVYTGVPGLAGAWTFDEGIGQIAFDTSNYGNHGELVYTNRPGPAWTVGKFAAALQFDGQDDQVILDGAGTLEDVTDESFTLAAWVNPESPPPNSSPNDSSYTVLARNYIGLYYDHDQRFRAVIRLSDGSEIAASSGISRPGVWHHLTMVVDDTYKKLHLYIDGQDGNNSPTSYLGTLANHEDAPYYVGTSEPLTELYEYRFHGKIDEVRIFDRALNPLEVQSLFVWAPSDSSCLLTFLPVIRK